MFPVGSDDDDDVRMLNLPVEEDEESPCKWELEEDKGDELEEPWERSSAGGKGAADGRGRVALWTGTLSFRMPMKADLLAPFCDGDTAAITGGALLRPGSCGLASDEPILPASISASSLDCSLACLACLAASCSSSSWSTGSPAAPLGTLEADILGCQNKQRRRRKRAREKKVT